MGSLRKETKMPQDLDAELLSLTQSSPSKQEYDDSDDSSQISDDEGSEEDFDEEEPDLSSMTELQREQYLAERYKKDKEIEERKKVKNKMRAKKNKQKTSTFSASGRSARSSGASLRTRQDEAMHDLVSKRARKGRDQDYEMDSDSDAGEASEEESEEEDGDSAEPPLELENLLEIQLKRSELSDNLNKPFFKTITCGFFVRVGCEIRGGERVYRACEIVGVKEGNRDYKVDGKKTNVVLTLKYGNSEQDYRMEYVSNAPLTQSEFDRWKLTSESAGVPPPKLETIHLKRVHRKEMEEFVFDDAAIDELVKKSGVVLPVSQRILQAKANLQKFKQNPNFDPEEEARLAQEITKLEAESQDQFNRQTSAATAPIYNINQRNRQRNIIEAKTQDQDDDAMDNPFKRRKTESTLIVQNSNKPASSSSQSSEKSANDSEPHVFYSVDREHNFDIHIDLEKIRSHATHHTWIYKISNYVPNDLKNKRTITLQDYRRKRGWA